MTDSFRYVLAFDSALSGCRAAVLDSQTGDGVCETFETPRGQAENLVPLIQRVVHQAGISFSDLSLVVTTVGPGSFTGLRVGLATARGLALAIGCPVQGVLSVDALAAAWWAQYPDSPGPVWVALDTRREDLFVCRYDSVSSVPCDPDQVQIDTPEAFSSLVGAGTVIGDGLGLISSSPLRIGDEIDPLSLAQLGLKLFLDPSYALRGVARPVYLRGAEVTVSKSSSRSG